MSLITRIAALGAWVRGQVAYVGYGARLFLRLWQRRHQPQRARRATVARGAAQLPRGARHRFAIFTIAIVQPEIVWFIVDPCPPNLHFSISDE